MPLLVKIENDSEEFYLSDKPYRGEHFYYPFVAKMPIVEIGSVNSAYIGIKYGQIELVNDQTDSRHPFGLGRFNSMLQDLTSYPVTISWNELNDPILTGSIYLQQITETSLVFDIADTVFEQTLLRYTITEGWSYVEEIIEGTPLTVKANGHSLIKGQTIVFENMVSVGSELNYSDDQDNWYQVGDVVDSDHFKLLSKDGVELSSDNYTVGTVTFSEGYNRVGNSAHIPFSFGEIVHRTPVIKKSSDEVANPYLIHNDPTNYPLRVYEDGVLIGTNEPGQSETFVKMPDEKTIYLNGVLRGVGSISGMSRKGRTLTQLFTYLANQLDLTYDGSKAFSGVE